MMWTARLLAAAVLVPFALAAEPVPAGAEPLSLAAAVDLAQRNSGEIGAAQARISQTDAMIDQAWALLLPTLTGTFRYTHFDQEIAIPFGPPGGPTESIVIQKQDQLDASAKLSVPLLNGRTIPLIRNLYDAYDVRLLARESLVEQVGHRAARAWLQVQTAQKATALATQDAAFFEEHLAAATKRKSLGAGTKIDILRARTELSRARGILEQRRRAALAAREALAVLTGRDPTGFSVSDAPPTIMLPVAPATPLEAMADSALVNHQDLVIAKTSITIADREVDEIWTRFLPSVSLDGNLNWSEAGGFSGDQTSWNIMVIAAWTAFDGGVRYGQLDEKRAAVIEAEANLKAMSDGIRAQLVAARAALDDAEIRLRSARETEALATEGLVAAEQAYRLGAGDYLIVFDAKSVAEQASLGVLAGEVAVAQGRLELRAALGLPAVDSSSAP